MPNVKEIPSAFERVTEIKEMLEKGNFKKNQNYVEAKSLATVAYIVLTEANKIVSENAELVTNNEYQA